MAAKHSPRLRGRNRRLISQARPPPDTASYVPPYGNLMELNTERLVMDAVGPETLTEIANDYLDMLCMSAAVYERNGDHALRILSSEWCQFMDAASRRLCDPADNREALACGKWRCHESCWGDASRMSIESGEPTDIECAGGIRLYAVPVRAGSEIVGSITFGYGDPPRDPVELRELAANFCVGVEELDERAAACDACPQLVIELVKKRLRTSARLIGSIVEHAQAKKQILGELRQRTVELTVSNKELEAFAYSVSHDLRGPLRAIDGFSQALLEDYAERLDDAGRDYLRRSCQAAQRMGRLIDDLLTLSRLARVELRKRHVDLAAIVRRFESELRARDPGRDAEIVVVPDLSVEGDPELLTSALGNLMENAWKFTEPHERARIEVGSVELAGERVFFVRDDGVGFDMRYVGKLFHAFQRLHAADEFAGTGIGLASVRSIIARHGGRVWAEGAVGHGATFYFTLT